MHAIRVLAMAFLCSTVFAQISQKEACQTYATAVVRIDARAQVESDQVSHGTGFLVSADGWILTSAHVVVNAETGKIDEGVSVILADGSVKIAQVLPIEPEMAGQDFAILKIEGNKLPSLDLGDKPDDIVPGSDLTIIGFPFGAFDFKSGGPGIKDKFCMSGTVAYFGNTDVPVLTKNPKESTTVNVNVDVIYFQGPCVKGLSGSPIISRDTGHVVGIVASKLTGISDGLEATRQTLNSAPRGLRIEGVPFVQTTTELIDTLDFQLANGLGAGTGIEDPKHALRRLRQRHTNRK
jgi:Trypsin-like peptidase domain